MCFVLLNVTSWSVCNSLYYSSACSWLSEQQGDLCYSTSGWGPVCSVPNVREEHLKCKLVACESAVH